MGFGDQIQKFKNFVGLNNDSYDDEYEYEDEYDEYEDDYQAEQPKAAPVANAATDSSFRPRKVGGQSAMTQRPTAMKVIVIEPKVFEDS